MKYAQVFLSLLTIGTAAQAAVINVSPSDQTDVRACEIMLPVTMRYLWENDTVLHWLSCLS